MESMAEILESELKEAVEVKNEKSLHRYITLLSENIVKKEADEREHSEFHEALLRIDTRIEEGFRRMDERFASVDKRFEAMDKRFEDLQRNMDKRFEAMQHNMDKRFEAMQHNMDKRFEAVDKRFDDVNQRFSMMFKFVTIGFVILATMMSVFHLLG